MECKLCAVAMDKIMSVKDSLSYNVTTDPMDHEVRTQYVANHVT